MPVRWVRVLLAVALVAGPIAAGCASDPAPPPTDGASPWTARVAELALDEVDPDGEAMMDLVLDQMRDADGELRYRTPGTEGHRATAEELEAMVQDAGLEPETEDFQAELPRELGETNLTNVYGVREGQDPDAGEIWIGAHWDSRAWADRNRDPCTGPPVPGANDGAAAVAVALHVAEQLPPTDHAVRVALFDAEDQGCEGEKWAVGSAHAADRLAEEGRLDRVEALVLVDMPGDPDLSVYREGHSHQRAPRLTNLAFEVADVTDAEGFTNETAGPVLDDHVAFLDKGVPAVDLIHNEPGPGIPFPDTWHTTSDTADNLSTHSLEAVATVTAGTVLGVDEGLHHGGAR